MTFNSDREALAFLQISINSDTLWLHKWRDVQRAENKLDPEKHKELLAKVMPHMIPPYMRGRTL